MAKSSPHYAHGGQGVPVGPRFPDGVVGDGVPLEVVANLVEEAPGVGGGGGQIEARF